MLSVKAIYDGEKLVFDEKIKISSPHEVIITFIDDPDEDITSSLTQRIAADGGAFDFLNDPGEDIYSDGDLKVKY